MQNQGLGGVEGQGRREIGIAAYSSPYASFSSDRQDRFCKVLY